MAVALLGISAKLLYIDPVCTVTDYHLWADIPSQYVTSLDFSALMLLVGRQEGHPACKKLSGFWHGHLSGVRCRLFAYGPADATASPNPITSCSI